MPACSPAQLHAALEQGLIVLSCELGTTDLLVANAGSIDIPAGTKLRWSVADYGAKGYAKLKQSLDSRPVGTCRRCPRRSGHRRHRLRREGHRPLITQ